MDDHETSTAWRPVCSFGDSADECRAALREAYWPMFEETIQEQFGMLGLSAEQLAAVRLVARQLLDSQIERGLPRLMADMKFSATGHKGADLWPV